MVNKEALGAEGPEFEVEVERGKIREFARATGSAHPAYLTRRRPVSPPTFLMSMGFWQPPEAAEVQRSINLDLRRLLHGEQEFVFFGPPPAAGTRLRARTVVEDIYEKEGRRGGTMTFVVTRTDFRDKSGVLRAQSRATAIETARPPSEGGEGS